jgi:hypothetical protein
MPQVGFEPTIPVFKRQKTAHALEGAANVIGRCVVLKTENVMKLHKHMQPVSNLPLSLKYLTKML